MKCYLKNSCTHKYLCCSFCKDKCDIKCKDNYITCKWFDNTTITDNIIKENIPPKADNSSKQRKS